MESAIALSVVFAALNNILPVVSGRRGLVAFCFGQINGFGFASALSDFQLPRDTQVLALLGFSLGVESGQLIVAAFVTLACAIRLTRLYRRLVLTGGSFVVALVATVWFAQRVFNLKVFSE